MIVFSSIFEEHLKRLEADFTRLQDHNLKLKASKCECLKSRVIYLGHVVSEAGIQANNAKTEGVKTYTKEHDDLQATTTGLFKIVLWSQDL